MFWYQIMECKIISTQQRLKWYISTKKNWQIEMKNKIKIILNNLHILKIFSSVAITKKIFFKCYKNQEIFVWFSDYK